jgi:hypothetical protein
MADGLITPPQRYESGGEEKHSASIGHRRFSQSFNWIIPAELTLSYSIFQTYIFMAICDFLSITSNLCSLVLP